MSQPSVPESRTGVPDAQRRESRRTGARYLPSAQVLAELACLGPDLGRLAEDLRARLTGSADDRNDVA